MSSKEIAKLVSERNIGSLLHFTHLNNLEQILRSGLKTRQQIDGLKPRVMVNDQVRADGRLDTVSLSIGHPNSRMFYKYRIQTEGHWAVIAVRRKVLWEKECLFCRHNAADDRISGTPDVELSGYKALQGMYDEIEGVESRETQNLSSHDPTDEQAEVLVKGVIEKEYIFGVVLPDKNLKKQFRELTNNIQIKIHKPNKGYYSSRGYRRKYS